MRRTLTAAVLALTLGTGMTATATGAPTTEEPTTVSVRDGKNDVLKAYRARPVKHDLDVRRTSATLDGENVVLRLKVKDLRAKHLKAEDLGGGSYQSRYALDTIVKFGAKPRWFIGWNSYPDTPDAAVSGKGWDCYDEEGYGRVLQAADLKNDVLTFTAPIECLPARKTRLKVSGYTTWDNDKGSFWDMTATAKNQTKYSPLLTFQ